MYTEWLAMEHYRMHLMEQWPEGARKDAGLAAARAAIEGLEQGAPAGSKFVCDVCANRKEAGTPASQETIGTAMAA